MEQIVRDALGSVNSPAYSAAVSLAIEYGKLLDSAAGVAAEVAEVDLSPRDTDGRRRLERVEKLVAAHAAYSDLGPKLLAALTALGATPASVKDAGGGGPVAGLPSPLQAARDAARARRAASEYTASA
jgi:hypothetical protein